MLKNVGLCYSVKSKTSNNCVNGWMSNAYNERKTN